MPSEEPTALFTVYPPYYLLITASIDMIPAQGGIIVGDFAVLEICVRVTILDRLSLCLV